MDAFETYYAAVASALLPGSVPVQSIDRSKVGLATQAVGFIGIPQAEALALSDDPKDRARAALFAVLHARMSIEKKHETIQPT